MKGILAAGTIKNYHTTARYLKEFMLQKFKKQDIYLSELNYEFITNFEFFLRAYQPTDHHKGMENNGVMKHLERLQKMVRLGAKLGWLDKNPFEFFKLKLQKAERGFLSDVELADLENKQYILSINQNHMDEIKQLLTPEEFKEIVLDNICHELEDHSRLSKLLGIQVDMTHD